MAGWTKVLVLKRPLGNYKHVGRNLERSRLTAAAIVEGHDKRALDSSQLAAFDALPSRGLHAAAAGCASLCVAELDASGGDKTDKCCGDDGELHCV